jgi:transcriptional regulator with XRE-family HTH domain
MSNETIGDRVREFREIKRLSREDLAVRSGLDEAFIADIEEHKVQPALGKLLRISRAMGIRMASFIDDSVRADPILVRAGDRDKALEEEIPFIKDAAGDLVFFPLGKGKIDRHMEPFFIDVLPQPPGQVKVSQHEGEEFIVVLSGGIELQYGDETFLMGPGDSVYYGSDTPHRLIALNGEMARIIAVIYFNA